MDFHQVIRSGRSGFGYTAISITVALVLGWSLGKLLRVEKTTAFLISTGTAICGGSAIAAISPITEASEEEIAVSLGTVFVLNSVVLFAFKAIDYWLHLSQSQFGLCDALAIPDQHTEFRRRRNGAIWRSRPRGGHSSKTGACTLDCAALIRNRDCQTEQRAHSLAVVHPSVLSGRCRQHIHAFLRSGISAPEAPGCDRPDGYPVSDWDRAFTQDNPRGGSATVAAGIAFVDRRWRRLSRADSHGMDSFVIEGAYCCRLLSESPAKPAV